MATYTSYKMEDYLILLNTAGDSSDVLPSLPILEDFEEGITEYVVSREAYKCSKDITHDHYRPWSGMYYNEEKGKDVSCKTKVSELCVEFVENQWVVSNEDSYRMKVFRNINPQNPMLSRHISYIINDEGAVCSSIIFRYFAEANLPAPIKNTSRLLPSTACVIREALHHRSTAEAKRFLADAHRETISSQQVASIARSVETHVRSKSGRRPVTDLSKVIDRYVTSFSKLEDIQPADIVRENDDVNFCWIIGYPVAIRSFVNDLPTREELAEYRKEFKKIDLLMNEDERRVFAEDMFNGTANESGSYPVIGTSLMIDTTFCLSSEYVTVAVGISEIFKSKNTGKNASSMLAVMFHTTKDASNHEKFASYLNKKFYEMNNSKVVGTLVHDGEVSFKHYNTGKVMKDSIQLRCDFHRQMNLKECFSRAEEESFIKIKRELFGYKKNTAQGVILKAGILSSLSRNTYDTKMRKLIQNQEGKIKSWLIYNYDSLFENNSLYNKMLGGWNLQYLTTNIIESRNNIIKKYITSVQPCHKVADALLFIHEDEVKEKIMAISQQSSKLMTLCSVQPYLWKTFTRAQQRSQLSLFGLENYFFESRFSNYPSWILDGDGSTSPDIFLSIVEKLQCHKSSSDTSFYTVTEETYKNPSIVIHDEGILTCFNTDCFKNKKNGYYLCVHRMNVFDCLDEDSRTQVIEKLETKRNSMTFRQFKYKRSKVTDGSKNTKRKFNQFSKGNYSRTYTAISDVSSSFISCDENNNFQNSIDLPDEDNNFDIEDW